MTASWWRFWKDREKSNEVPLINSDSPTSAYTSNEEDTFTEMDLNEIYEIMGTGFSQVLYWTLSILVAYSDYADLTVISVIMPSLRCEWDLDTYFETCITFVTFGSYALFAIIFGKISDRYGRKTVLGWGLFTLTVGTVVSAFSPNKWVFLATRFVVGASVGINYSTAICFAVECAKSSLRALGCSLVVLAALVSVVLVTVLAYFLLNTVGWRYFTLISGSPAVPAFIFLMFLPDSPRYLCASGQQDKSTEAVRYMAKLNCKEIPENVKVKCVEEQKCGSFSMVLNEENRTTAIGLSVMYFCNIVIEFGYIVYLPLFFSTNNCGKAEEVVKGRCEGLTQDDLLDLSIASTGSLVGLTCAFALSLCVGRIIPMRVSSFLMIISLILLFFCVNETFTLVSTSLVKLLESFINTCIWIMIPESFPTNIRSTATGFINAWGKIGGMVGTTAVYLLFSINSFAVLGLFLVCAVIGFIAMMTYKKETKDVVLTDS